MDALFVSDDPNADAADIALARRMAEVLHRHYPGHAWAVNVSHRTGVASVQNFALSGRWGFRLFLVDLKSDSGMVSVMRAGGELLERWNVARTKYSPELLQHVPQPLGSR